MQAIFIVLRNSGRIELFGSTFLSFIPFHISCLSFQCSSLVILSKAGPLF